MSAVARLTLKGPAGTSALLLRAGDTLRVGRQEGNEIVLQEKKASRHHGVFTVSNSGVLLTDLKSLNGTFVNGQRIQTPVDLRSGDTVRIGETTFSLELLFEELSGPIKNSEDSGGATQAIGMESTVVTVLVADVVGYTRLSQTLPAGDVAEGLEVWFDRVSRVVRACGGEVDKYLGDAVLAVWRGSGEEGAQALALRAGEAALEIHRQTAQMNCVGQWAHFAEYPWRCRVSLNSGTALVGAIGSKAIREFTVLGDTVNVAFRLNDLAAKLNHETVLSKKTAELVQEQQKVRFLASVALEGRIGEEEVFALESEEFGERGC